MTVGPIKKSARVSTQITEIAEQQLEPEYFRKRTTKNTAKAALNERIERDDRILLLLYPESEIKDVNESTTLSRSEEILGFGFFGTYTMEEMDQYMAVPVEDVFSPQIFSVGHLRNVTLREDVQGDSHGYNMASYALGRMYEMGHRIMVTCLWNQEGTPGTIEYAEKVGAERVAEYEQYFEDRVCPACGFSTDCTCTFAFFKWELE